MTPSELLNHGEMLKREGQLLISMGDNFIRQANEEGKTRGSKAVQKRNAHVYKTANKKAAPLEQ